VGKAKVLGSTLLEALITLSAYITTHTSAEIHELGRAYHPDTTLGMSSR